VIANALRHILAGVLFVSQRIGRSKYQVSLEKYEPASERLSDYQLERQEQERISEARNELVRTLRNKA
jgi:hypothetical protein